MVKQEIALASAGAIRFKPCSKYVFLMSGPVLYAMGSVPSLSGHAIAYRWRSLRRESAGTEPVNLKVVPNECCLGRSPLIYASLSHTHYWYEVSMLIFSYLFVAIRAGLAFDRCIADLSCHRSFFSCKDNTLDVFESTTTKNNNMPPVSHNTTFISTSYLGGYWPCAGGLSAVKDIIGTQLHHDLINSLGNSPIASA